MVRKLLPTERRLLVGRALEITQGGPPPRPLFEDERIVIVGVGLAAAVLYIVASSLGLERCGMQHGAGGLVVRQGVEKRRWDLIGPAGVALGGRAEMAVKAPKDDCRLPRRLLRRSTGVYQYDLTTRRSEAKRR